MERLQHGFISFLLLISFSVSVSHATLPIQIYWQKVLPHTHMPSAIRDLIRADTSTVDTSKLDTHAGSDNGTPITVSHKGVHVDSHHKGTPPIIVDVKPFFYRYAATDTQIHDDPKTTLFFLEKTLHSNTKMKLNFVETTPKVSFIPRSKANSISFSSAKLPEILKRLKIAPDSLESETLKKTLQECERPVAKGETKYCATSLESMIDFATKSLNTTSINAMSTTIKKDEVGEQEYTISNNELKRMNAKKLVVCHLEEYKYAVFYCHATTKSRAYVVKLAGNDGMAAVEAVAVCHTDTVGWNPKHVAFWVLGVKPGTVPVCHFLPQDHVVWGAKN